MSHMLQQLTTICSPHLTRLVLSVTETLQAERFSNGEHKKKTFVFSTPCSWVVWANHMRELGTLKLDLNFLPAETWIWDTSQRVCVCFNRWEKKNQSWAKQAMAVWSQLPSRSATNQDGRQAGNGIPRSKRVNKTWEGERGQRSISSCTNVKERPTKEEEQ